jgi:hypothetical protein
MLKVDIQTVSIVVAMIGVFIAAINSVYSSRESRQQRQTEIQTRQAQLFMEINQRVNTTEMRHSLQKVLYVEDWTNFDDWQQKYGYQSDLWVALTQLGSYFGGLGVYVERGLVDPTMIDDLMGEYIIAYWEKLEQLVMDARKTVNPRQGDKIVSPLQTVKTARTTTTVDYKLIPYSLQFPLLKSLNARS